MLTFAELRDLAVRHGFPDPDTAAAVALAESRGDPRATNIVTHPKPGNGPERSFGLWQINTLAHPHYDESRLLDPDYNAQAALEVSGGGKTWRWWSTYQNKNPADPNSYLHYLPAPAGPSVVGDDQGDDDVCGDDNPYDDSEESDA